MQEKTFETPYGVIRYWRNELQPDRKTLVLLPGLTADHHLFDRQIEAFENTYSLLTWDAPGHGRSRPFHLNFSLMDKAQFLHDILEKEGIRHPVLAGQSMGGYVSQCFLEKYPNEAEGFISIDSAPLKRRYLSSLDLMLLKHMEPVYRLFPWRLLKHYAVIGCSETEYGRALMNRFLDSFDPKEYCHLAGHGLAITAEAIEADLPYEIPCRAILICGEKDQAGYVKNMNRRWAKEEGLPLFWIQRAGHNANTDRPEEVNRIIDGFMRSLGKENS